MHGGLSLNRASKTRRHQISVGCRLHWADDAHQGPARSISAKRFDRKSDEHKLARILFVCLRKDRAKEIRRDRTNVARCSESHFLPLVSRPSRKLYQEIEAFVQVWGCALFFKRVIAIFLLALMLRNNQQEKFV